VSAERTLAVSKAEIAKCEAQVAQARASLENAQEDLRNSTIVSPIDGLVLSRDVNIGDCGQFHPGARLSSYVGHDPRRRQ